MSPTKGSQALRGALRPQKKQVDLARELGVTKQAITNWLAGGLPSVENMRKLEDLLGIPMRDWTEPSNEPPAVEPPDTEAS